MKTHTLLRTDGPVTLVGGGLSRPEDIAAALAVGPELVAADGGAAHAIACGHVPDLVIGDLDSLTPATREHLPEDRIHHVAEQDSTDFEKCLTRIDAPLVLATGVLGARIDHALAVFTTMIRHLDRPCMAISADDVVFAAPPRVSLNLSAGTRVSLYPLSRVTGRSEGLRWPIGGLDFAPDGQIGTSNVATGPVRLTFHIPGMLIILPRAALDAAVAALMPPD